jgi:predicted DNA-binding transcriptional regulator YafY
MSGGKFRADVSAAHRSRCMARQWKLIRLLAANGGTPMTRLRSELECSRRTVYRDLEVLMEAGFPVCSETVGRQAAYRFPESFSVARYFREAAE